MSKQNKVNPGKYTQAGRLSQDDAAREMMRQRASIAAQNHQQQARSNRAPWEISTPAAIHEEPADQEEKAAPTVAKKPARPAVKAKAKRKTVATARKPRAAKSVTAKSRRPARKAALARSVVKSPASAKKKAKRTKGPARRSARR